MEEELYGKYIYPDTFFPHYKRYTRLLRFQPSGNDDKLWCTLEVAEIDPEIPSFNALSYAWGEPVFSHKIYCGTGARVGYIEITATLHAALLQLRQSPFSDKAFWIDALCIDQSSASDRNLQVPYMSQIFSLADVVIVWLGSDHREGEEAIRIIRNYSHDLKSSKLLETDIIDAEPFLGPLHVLLSCSWFTRRWVVQELVSAQHAQVWYGTEQTNWNSFANITKLVDMACPDVEATRLAERSQRVIARLEAIRNNWTYLRSTQFLMMFFAFSAMECSLQRDHLYALSSLGAKYAMKEIPVRYDHGLLGNFTSFAGAILTMSEVSNPVEPLLHCATHFSRGSSGWQHQWPSWVPDLTLQPRCQPFAATVRRLVRPQVKAVKRAAVRVNDPRTLSVLGAKVDTIQAVTDSLSMLGTATLAQYSDDEVVLDSGNTWTTADAIFKAYWPLFQRAYRTCEDDFSLTLSADVSDNAWFTADSTETIEETQRRLDEERDARTAMCHGWHTLMRYSHDGTNVEMDAPTLSLDQLLEIGLTMTPEEAGVSLDFLKRVSLTMQGRICFLTSGGFFGICPEGVQPGDTVVVLEDACSPYIFHPMTGTRYYRVVGEALIHQMDATSFRALPHNSEVYQRERAKRQMFSQMDPHMATEIHVR